MRVVCGFATPLPDDQTRNPYRVEELRASLGDSYSLRNLGGKTGQIPPGKAFVIVGGRTSIYDEMSGLRGMFKLVAGNGSGIVVSSSRAGSKYASASRFLEEATKIGGAAALTPTGAVAAVNTLQQGGSFASRYLGGLKVAKQVFGSPGRVIDHSRSVARTWILVQVIGGGKGRRDQIAALAGVDLSSETLFNLLLKNRLIKPRKVRGKGGGVVNFESDDADEDDDSI